MVIICRVCGCGVSSDQTLTKFALVGLEDSKWTKSAYNITCRNPIVKPDVKLEVDPGTGPGGQPSPIFVARHTLGNATANPEVEHEAEPEVEPKVFTQS